MTVTLKINFIGDRLILKGPVSGKRYEYIPARDGTVLQGVEEVDVPGFRAIKTHKGCGCPKNGEGGGGVIEEDLFPL